MGWAAHNVTIAVIMSLLVPVFGRGQRTFSSGAESLKLFNAYKPTIEQRNDAIVDKPRVLVGDINGDHFDDCLIHGWEDWIAGRIPAN